MKRAKPRKYTKLKALTDLARRNGGLLRPADVVEEARDENSPLHSSFIWDDTEAARLYRLDQAQRLIRSFRFKVEDKEGKSFEVPVFINVSTDRTGDKDFNPYRLTESVAKIPNLMAVAERDALEQLRGLRDRYGYLTRLGDVWSAIDSHK